MNLTLEFSQLFEFVRCNCTVCVLLYITSTYNELGFVAIFPKLVLFNKNQVEEHTLLDTARNARNFNCNFMSSFLHLIKSCSFHTLYIFKLRGTVHFHLQIGTEKNWKEILRWHMTVCWSFRSFSYFAFGCSHIAQMSFHFTSKMLTAYADISRYFCPKSSSPFHVFSKTIIKYTKGKKMIYKQIMF